MTEKVTLIFDEGSSSGHFAGWYGEDVFAVVTPSQRIPDAADDILVGQIPVKVCFIGDEYPSKGFYPNDLIGPQNTDGTPGWNYRITYPPSFPGSPKPWNFIIKSTDGPTQRLSGVTKVLDPATNLNGTFFADSILDSVKKVLGLSPTDTSFDTDVLMHLNMAFGSLTQLGCGIGNGFSVNDTTLKWSDYESDTTLLSLVKPYIYLKVKRLFDPPTGRYALDAIEKQLDELQVRINVAAESVYPPVELPIGRYPKAVYPLTPGYAGLEYYW